MVEKSNIAMYVVIGLIAVVAIGLTVYFVFFKNKKDDDTSGGDPDVGGGSQPTFGAPSDGGSGGRSEGGADGRDVDILSNMGTDGNNLVLSAFSLRRQRSDYTGPIVILRRDYAGGQGQTAMFKATSDGKDLVNDAGEKLDSWVGAHLVKWYDQSGNNRDATPMDTPAVLRRTQPKAGVPSYYAFDMSGGRLTLGSNQRSKAFNEISIYSDSNPKMPANHASLEDFGSTWVNTVFVFSNGIDSNWKNFLEEDRNPSLKQIRM